MASDSEVSEAGRALWRRLWIVSADVQLHLATLSSADRRLLASEAAELARVVRDVKVEAE